MTNLVPIDFDGERYALVFVNQSLSEGVHFLTPDDMPLQVGMLIHPTGKHIKPHVHRPLDKTVHSTYEVLYVIEGRIEVQFYARNGEYRGCQQLSSGDFILLMNGGHGLTVLESCRIMEVKQGPYLGVEVEKIMLEVSE